ncbi:MAG: hypothetical protein M1814_001184 [Vezdaea aestivalis]|nr:MAG: hypothetical protein M1814_001184 [Vezdaea aestivalis]
MTSSSILTLIENSNSGSQLPVCATPLFAGGYTALFCWNSELPDPFVIAATYDGFTTPIKLPRYIGVDNSYTYETQTPTGASEALTASIPQITGSDFGKTSLNLSGSSTVPTISNGFTGFSSMPTALNGKGLSTSDRIAVGVGAPVGLFTIVGAVCAVLALIKRKRKVGLVLKTEQGSRDELRLEMRGIQKPESSEPEDEEPSDPQGKESPHI